MDFDRRAVQRNGLHSESQNLLSLQTGKHSVHDTGLTPAIHPGVNGVPVAEVLGQPAPFAALLGHKENSVEHLKVGQTHIAALPGQTVGNPRILALGNFHPTILQLTPSAVN